MNLRAFDSLADSHREGHLCLPCLSVIRFNLKPKVLESVLCFCSDGLAVLAEFHPARNACDLSAPLREELYSVVLSSFTCCGEAIENHIGEIVMGGHVKIRSSCVVASRPCFRCVPLCRSCRNHLTSTVSKTFLIVEIVPEHNAFFALAPHGFIDDPYPLAFELGVSVAPLTGFIP